MCSQIGNQRLNMCRLAEAHGCLASTQAYHLRRGNGSNTAFATRIFVRVVGVGGIAGNLTDMEELLPVMAHGERLLLVQTFIPFDPAFQVGLDIIITFRSFTFTRPRYAGQVPFDGSVTSVPFGN
jgi:hypothetical protein